MNVQLLVGAVDAALIAVPAAFITILSAFVLGCAGVLRGDRQLAPT